MNSANKKWLIHTLLIGLIPVFARLLTWATAMAGKVEPLSAADFITLGLVVQISIINETGHIHSLARESKTHLNGLAFLFITIFGALYALAAISEHNTEPIDASLVLISSIACCIGSTALGLTLFQQLLKRSRQ